MNFCDAVREAEKTNSCITTSALRGHVKFDMFGERGCTISQWDGSVSKYWSPTAEQILQEDWEVVV